MQCRITIKDEVNTLISGLDVNHRKELVKKFKIEKPGVRHTPAVKLGRWDGKVPFFNLGGMTYINLLPDIIPMLDSWGYELEVEDLREYSTNFEFDEVNEDSLRHVKWPDFHQNAGQDIVLRDYQVDAINTFFNNPQGINVLPTSGGKTLITTTLSRACEKYGRTIIIVPNRSLVKQTEEDYVNVGLDVGVYYGGRKEYDKSHTICTWQSLHALHKDTINNDTDVTFSEFIDGVVAVIVDEAQSAQGQALLDMLSGPMAKIPIRWGLTGTIPKEEYSQVCLSICLGKQIGHLGAKELQDKGVLSSCNVNIVQLKDTATFKDYQTELKYLVSTPERLDYISSLIAKVSDAGNTLVLVDRVNTGKYIASMIEGAVFVNGATKDAKRKEEYDSIRTEDNKVLVATYGVAAVGLNIVRIKNLVMIEPGKSFVRVIQSIGRGLRKGFDKDHVEIWDITSTCKFSKRHLTQRKNYYREVQYPFVVEQVDWR